MLCFIHHTAKPFYRLWNSARWLTSKQMLIIDTIYWVFILYTLCVYLSPSIISQGRVSKPLMQCLFTNNGTMPVAELSNLLETAAQQWGSQHLKQGMGSSFLTVMLWSPWFFFDFFFLFKLIPLEYRASLVAQMVKHLPAMWETQVWSLGWKDPLEKEMATHSSILAWKIPWTEEPGGL